MTSEALDPAGSTLPLGPDFEYSHEYQAKQLDQRQLWMRALTGHVFEVVGLIGVGKTGLLLSILHAMEKRKLRHQYFREELPWDLFTEFVAQLQHVTLEKPYNPAAFPFQQAMLKRRAQINRNANSLTEVGITCWNDGGLITDRTFARMLALEQQISAGEWQQYLTAVPPADTIDPSLVIVLDASPALCLKRQAIRKREGEQYTLKYMVDLRNTYAETLSRVKYTLLVVDWSEDLSDRMELHQSARVQDYEYKNGQCLLPEERVFELLKLVYYTLMPPPYLAGPQVPQSPLRHRIFRGGNGAKLFRAVRARGPDAGLIF